MDLGTQAKRGRDRKPTLAPPSQNSGIFPAASGGFTWRRRSKLLAERFPPSQEMAPLYPVPLIALGTFGDGKTILQLLTSEKS